MPGDNPIDLLVDSNLRAISDPNYKTWRAKYPQLTDTNDYDLYQAYKLGAVPDARGHLDDIGKLPNHITYSTGSWYAQQPGAPQAGKWLSAAKGWVFRASKQNVKNAGGIKALQDYFRKYEPESVLILPEEK